MTTDCKGFDLSAIRLSNGSHGPEFCGEACALEWTNRAATCVPELRAKYGAPSRFEDDHPSVSRVIRSYVIGLNDAWDNEQRQKLAPYVVRILGTATTPEDEEARAWLATDWLCRVYTPAWLRLAGLEEHARALESLARISDATLAEAAQPALDRAQEASAAAWDAASAAAWDAASAAAWDAAWAAAWDAASAAARAAASDAAWDAASDAARAAAWAAASDAAWAAARAAAWAAASDAAWAAAWAAASAAVRDAAWAAVSDAAWAAAWAALRPTVEALQASALVLLDAMIAVGSAEARARDTRDDTNNEEE